MLDLIGVWGDRPDSLRSCVQRLQASWRSMPPDPGAYGPWSVRDRGAAGDFSPLTRVDIDDADAVERAIAAETEWVHKGPRTAPGVYLEFDRESLVEKVGDGSREWAKEAQYKGRAGFFNPHRAHNRVTFTINSATEPAVVRDYFTALVRAWEPDHLAVTTFELSKAQGRRTPQMDIGWLTYIRDTIPLDPAVLDSDIAISQADGGRYLTLPGTPADPDLDRIMAVRRALGYFSG